MLLVVVVGLLVLSPWACADGDPASDVLLGQNVFYPYQPPVSGALSAVMSRVLGEAAHAGVPLKVAIIGSPEDLGAVFEMFGHPQQYARFLDREITFNHPQPLLVVMPAGFGIASAGSPAALAGVRVKAKSGTYGLVRSAILAVVAMARARGARIATPALPAQSASGGGGPPTLLFFGIPVLLLILIGLVVGRNSKLPAQREQPGGPGA